MRRLIARAQPSFGSVLLIESGPRTVADQFLTYLYDIKQSNRVDVLTCYGGSPSSFDSNRGVVRSVHEPAARQNRSKFIRDLSAESYDLVALLCTGSPILEKWKWMIALRTPARLIVVNESAKYFGLDIWNLGTARLMLLKRLNPFSDSSLGSFAEAAAANLFDLLLMPFVFLYLLIDTAAIHLRRRSRLPKTAAS